MKNRITLGLIAFVAFASLAFTNLVTKEVKVKESTIKWTGHKVTGSTHYGSIKLKEGTLNFEGDKLIGGMFVMDMNSIQTEDMDAEKNAYLTGHLKNDDFFGVEKHPTATLKITNARGHNHHYHVSGDLTIKGITKIVSFEMTVKDNTASTKFKIDRTQFDIKYGSASFFDNLKDKAISDEFDLDVTLKF
ncbi:YceI family protein [Pseudofulvibacter geojedonensis]|uniref:YceI family protein n=1 Tax=Pseudofulvibacter geojedonensis TaxID=1123758 RepID=A0ABW3I5U3_9FLAO